MLKLKKTMALFGVALMLMQGVPGLNLSNNKAEAATYKPAVQELMSRPYPRIGGNQWHMGTDGTFGSGDTANKVQFAAKYMDFVSLNMSSDLFLDLYRSTHDPARGALKLRNEIYNAASAVGRRVYVLPYHNMTDVWNYESINNFPNENFWMKPDGENIGTWDYMNKHNYWLRSSSGSIVAYPGYSNSQRRFWDPRKVEVREYWAQHAKGIVDQGFDGVFADNWLRSGFSSTDTTGVQNGWNATGARFKELAPDKILIGNSPPFGVFTTRDICMLEDRIDDVPTGDRSITGYLNYSDQAASMGQACFDTYWDEDKGPFETFRVPMSLLTDNILGLTLHTKQGHDLAHQQSVIEKLGKIGFPKAPRYKANGVLQRDFDYGKTIVNDTGSSVTVQLPSGVYKNLNGTAVNSVTLSGYRGIVLKTDNTIPPPVVNVPEAPTNLAVTNVTKGATSGEYYVNLQWTDSSNNEANFKLYQSVGSDDNFQAVKTPAANTTTYGVNLGTTPTPGTYYYKLTAVNTAGESQPSNTVNAPINTVTIPTAPTGLTATPSKSSTGDYVVDLKWTDSSNNETGFQISQSVGPPTNYQQAATAVANATAAQINLGKTPTFGTYNYQVVSVNSAGESQPSNAASAQIVDPVPVAPSALTITGVTKGATSGTYYVNLKWTDNANNETGFKLYQSIGAESNYQVVKTPAANATGYGLNLGTTPASGVYYYKITAVNGADESLPSNTVNTQINTVTKPAAPSGVTATSSKLSTGEYVVNLKWTDNSSNETGFKVLQSLNSTTSYQQAATAAANATTSQINLGKTPIFGTYNYQVMSANSAGDSAASNTASVKLTNPVPAAPTNLTLISVTKGATSGYYYVNLKWTDNSTNETGFQILQSINSTSNFQVVKSPAVNATTYGINLGTTPVKGTYYYKIVAINTTGKSPESNRITATIK